MQDLQVFWNRSSTDNGPIRDPVLSEVLYVTIRTLTGLFRGPPLKNNQKSAKILITYLRHPRRTWVRERSDPVSIAFTAVYRINNQYTENDVLVTMF